MGFTKLLIAVLFTGFSICKITLDRGESIDLNSLKTLHNLNNILVEASYDQIDDSKYDRIYLMIRSADKSKQAAYTKLITKYKSIVKILIKQKIIPNQQSMIHSIVHHKFYKKQRKWEYFRYFMIYSLKRDCAYILDKIKQYRPETIKQKTLIKYFDEKVRSIAAFTEAKLELENFIEQYLNSEYKILLTQNVQIIGEKIDNEDLIEEDLRDEFNNEDEYEKDDSKQERVYQNRGSKGKQKSVKIRVLFQIVERGVDVQDILEGLEKQEDSSEGTLSDFDEIDTSDFDEDSGSREEDL